MKIAFYAFGEFPTSIALFLSAKFKHDPNVQLYFYDTDKDIVPYFNKHRKNPKYFNDDTYTFYDNIKGVRFPKHLLWDADYVFLGVPAQSFYKSMPTVAKNLTKDSNLIIVSKGIDIPTRKRLSVILQEALQETKHHPKIAVFSGGTKAKDLADKKSLVGTVASEDPKTVIEVGDLLTGKYLTPFPSTDMVAVELASALKNVLSIAIGMVNQYDFGMGTASSLFGGIYTEIYNIARKSGAKESSYLPGNGAYPATLLDDILSSFSDTRNLILGENIAKYPNKEPSKIVEQMEKKRKTFEGYYTSAAAHQLAKDLDVKTPFMDIIYKVLHSDERGNRLMPAEAVQLAVRLTTVAGRKARKEFAIQHFPDEYK